MLFFNRKNLINYNHFDFNIQSKVNFWHKIKVDPILLISILLIFTLGLFVLYSATGQNIKFIYSQIAHFGLGLLVMYIISNINPLIIKKLSIYLYIFVIILLLLVIFKGSSAKGATRWLDLGVIKFQPSEFAKVIVPVFIASFVSGFTIPISFKNAMYALALISLPCLLIGMQPDFGTALIVGLSCLIIIFLANISWRYIITAILLIIVSIPIIWNYVLLAYQKKRVITFLNPDQDPTGTGWNITQSKIAIGSGGMFGKGYLEGTQYSLDFLPESHTDFIWSVYTEDFGFVGAIVLISLYLVLIIRCMVIANNSNRLFQNLLASAIGFSFFVYIFINLGMVSGILPVIGAPLPFLSYGGSNLLAAMISLGFVTSIASFKR